MSLKKQFVKVKENWLLILLVLILVGFVNAPFASLSSLTSLYPSEGSFMGGADYAKIARGGYPSPIVYDEGFAPGEKDRVITKNAQVTSEVERGRFDASVSRVKESVSRANGLIVNEYVNRYGVGAEAYYQGTFQVKVETSKYDALVLELKGLGEVQTFNENVDDVTAQYISVEDELSAEKARLQRYRDMLSESMSVEEKITLSDRIFEQERRVKFLEKSLEQMDERVDYSSISLTLTEKRSSFAGAVFVKFGDLVRSFVASTNTVIRLVVSLLPWVILLGIVWWIVRKVRK